MSHFEELKVWQKAVDLAVRVYEITTKDPFNKSDFSLKDTQTLIANRIGYLSMDDSNYLKKECKEILAMLQSLIKYRNEN